MFRQEILLANGEWENTSWVGDDPLYFETYEDAAEDLAEFFDEMTAQGMDFYPADYRIVEV